MNDIYYFAYGMNTNLAGMASRCPGAVSLGHAVLKNHKFRFAVHADIIQHNTEYVDGVLWKISTAHLESLDAQEGYPWYYDRKEVEVVCNGSVCTAVTYFMQPGNICKMPSEGYLNSIIEGYSKNGVPAQQVERALSVVKKQQHSVA